MYRVDSSSLVFPPGETPLPHSFAFKICFGGRRDRTKFFFFTGKVWDELRIHDKKGQRLI